MSGSADRKLHADIAYTLPAKCNGQTADTRETDCIDHEKRT